ncbi:MAG: UDP-N-acetylmuramoyl-L-alanyl-D-glutamate--2,6-diaminopimelate ligase [Bacteroidales bacterium]|jgi:UDP-N-acetylmuramoyl-L-alanyl-D-glutamate--2,6-diaminopimelate ligase|nr:UDP-N-acetylmuramoyl-L-alanyl-D-glutamate--2,6-diaminopimelate ligase [Bacteroidales bacterium]MDD2687435.1 UDP-N-acetylmuramoyl-L-alanyl-D-glutamate--2,6-diaminopimelate ligase [Bacteroidales bacterium]MDD3330641.1 UDP-N-acetylmuramoyl-L-alanyl-D-glutamate--2,6-diaminopimelate ligase [Bacteroidales bacterium]MDD3691570.1 UDP-N-acetylmuramoyl-L-alanyl-D-glutamate--2,6-diaminopimelate ligase [Bacteroidales bacterium]MDD4045012.1 UDP-N-acetylmuramoyl-L-alanyl-D-glutamate--2,6-diaminopimelate l
MKTCKELIDRIPIKQIIGNVEIPIHAVCFDSREVLANTLFVAQKGNTVDGHDYIDKAIAKGACCIVLENLPAQIKDGITYIQVENASFALGWIAAAFYNYPSEKLTLIGITGTNGKTTSVTLLHRLFRDLTYKVGLLSTIENKINDEIIPSTHTTPDAVTINRLLAKMLDKGCQFCFMEVSSHAIVQHRISGLHFKGAIFSNITHDHLDYHKTFKEYIYAKKMFFDNLSNDAFALSNMDDTNGMVMLQNTKAKRFTYSLLNVNTDFKATINTYDFEGMQLTIDKQEIWFRLTGTFNAYNLLVVYAVTQLLGIDKQEALRNMSLLEPAEGRFVTLNAKNKVTAIVDYAHTPDALKNVLKAIRNIRKPEQKILTLIGCGGNRDKSKRPEMAKIAYDLSDILILTSDNPRNENPINILDDMIKGIEKEDRNNVFVIENREQAIKLSASLAKKNDIILIAGKGHEKYQEINGIKHHFDDMEIIKNYLTII